MLDTESQMLSLLVTEDFRTKYASRQLVEASWDPMTETAVLPSSRNRFPQLLDRIETVLPLRYEHIYISTRLEIVLIVASNKGRNCLIRITKPWAIPQPYWP